MSEGGNTRSAVKLRIRRFDDKVCPYVHCRQVWNMGKMDDCSEPWCAITDHACDQVPETCNEFQDLEK
jgi:hypothetical protein